MIHCLLLPFIDDLISQLNQISPDVLEKYEIIVKEFSVLKDPKCILPLINSFGYGEGNGVYWSALHLLEEFSVEQVDPLLIQRLKTGKKGTRMWAAYMLSRSKNTSAVDALINLLKDENELVRRNAAVALEMIGDCKAKPYLEAIKDDTSSEVRIAVERALNSL